MGELRISGCLVRAAVAALSLGLAPVAAALVPAGFGDARVAAIVRPVGLSATPDGRVLVTTQTGQLHVIRLGALLSPAALDLSGVLCSNSERGLLGVLPGPNFAVDRLIYLYYTYDKFGGCLTGRTNPTPVNRVSRFRLEDTNTVEPASEEILVDNIPSIAGNHNGGDMHFGPDGYLYIAVGDSGESATAPRADVLAGKLLRVDADGLPAPGNPFFSLGRRCGDPAGLPPGANPCAELWAWGLRNPFRFAFRPGGGELYINDVGAGNWEEIDIGAMGGNFGWPTKEGPCELLVPTRCVTIAGLIDPIFSYGHADGCSSITGATFVPGGLWPAPWDGGFLFADWACGRIFLLADDGSGGRRREEFASALGNAGPVSLAFLDDGQGPALWYTRTSGMTGGDVRRIAWTPGSNRPPEAAARATPDLGPVPLAVAFDGGSSRDPDLDPLTYDWDFGDGNRALGLTVPTVNHSYTAPGVFIATLVVDDGQGNRSTPASVRIDAGNTAPVPAIANPTALARFAVGQTVVLTGSASDAEDGPLPDSSLSWQLYFHHVPESSPANRHAHPFLAPTTGNGIAITPPSPEDFDAALLSYLEILLTATDSWGRSQTITQVFEPNRVRLDFETVPAGLAVVAGGGSILTPASRNSWEAWGIPLLAPLQRDVLGQGWAFASWSDGGGRSHPLVTPAAPLTLTATYRPWPDPALQPSLLRNDRIGSLATARALLSSIFANSPAYPSLEVFGGDRLAGEGEGALRAGNGSQDDDDFYIHGFGTAVIDTDPGLLADASRPLVFYQIDSPDGIIHMVRLGADIGIQVR